LEDERADLKSANDASRARADELASTSERLSREIKTARELSVQLTERNGVLSAQAIDLESSLQKLNAQKDELAEEVVNLKAQRAKYAEVALSNVWAKIGAMSVYDLAMYRHVARACASFQQHVDWMSAKRRGKRYIIAPDFWIRYPDEPSLEPNNRQMLVGEKDVHFLNSDDYVEYDRYARNWLFDQIVATRGGVPMTGAMFIEKVKAYPFYSGLMPEEKADLFSQLDGFLLTRPDLRESQFNVSFTAEPSSSEIIESGKQMQPKADAFLDAFSKFLRGKNVQIDAAGLDAK